MSLVESNIGFPAQGRPTKRAPDGWESARFWKLVLNDGSFPFRELVLPAAGNAGRWAHELCQT